MATLSDDDCDGIGARRRHAKVLFCQSLGDEWRNLADLVGIPPYARRRFDKGDESRSLWEWLEQRRRLSGLIVALPEVGRSDLARLVELGHGPQTRRYAPTRAALDGAKIMPVQRRTIVDELFVPRMDEAIERPTVVAIVADPGMGKSVLLGQSYDTTDHRHDLGVVLLSCAALAGGRPHGRSARRPRLHEDAFRGRTIQYLSANASVGGWNGREGRARGTTE